MQALTETIEFELELTARERAAKELVVRVSETTPVPACAQLCIDLGLPPHAIDHIRRGKQPQHGKVFWTITFSAKVFRDDAHFKREGHFRRLQLDLRPSNTRRQRIQRRKFQSIEEVLSRYVCHWLWSPSGILLTLTHGDPLRLRDADHAASVMRDMNFALKEVVGGSPRRQTQAQVRRQTDRGNQEDQLPERTHEVRQTDPGTQPPGMTQQPMDADLPPHMAGAELALAHRRPQRGCARTATPPPARTATPPPARAEGASGSGSGLGAARERSVTPGRGRGGRGGRGGRVTQDSQDRSTFRGQLHTGEHTGVRTRSYT
jgi:hypothetical protein